MTDADPQYQMKKPARRKWPYLLGALVVIAGGVYGGIEIHDHLVSCAPGVKKTGPHEECIGVSDSFHFDESLGSVMEKIHNENDRVAGSGKPWVSIAYVEPFGDEQNPEAGKYGARKELEGAYVAQRLLNHADLGGHGEIPQIKLFVGNLGLRSEQWKPLTDQLIAMTHDDHRLVAVAGFGQSYEGTKEAVDHLRDAKVPMMGTTVTADNLSSTRKTGFFRVAVPNEGQAMAAVKYLKGIQKKDPHYTVMVIRDRNDTDIYNTSMYDDFKAAAGRQQLRLEPSEPQYVSDNGDISDAFSSVAGDVCVSKPDVVFFAGRGIDLRGFITAMSAADRRCPVTVLTGDDAAGVYFHASSASNETRVRFAQNWRKSRVTVRYTALSHPDLSKTLKSSIYGTFRDHYNEEFDGSGDDAFQDGLAILAHDSVWTLGLAIRPPSGDANSSVDAEKTLSRLVSQSKVIPVQGASGPITLGDDGNPLHKPMALVKLQPEEGYTFLQTLQP